MLIKLLDGRAINGHFWMLYGSLSTLETTITIVDEETQETRTYFNAAGPPTSHADFAAF